MKIDYTKKYALAVSGGIDSMVMLHIFANTEPRPDFFVVTVNHNIRREAQSDCDFVKAYCKKFGIVCKEYSVDVPSYAEATKVSLETGARQLRYGVFNTLECDYVCLAHQANDNAETVFMHIIRGSGAHGAEGIREQNDRFLRPILNMTRKDIEDYANKHDVPFVLDKTNLDTKYTRNFIRLEVMPKIVEVNENAVANIARFAKNMAQDNEYLDSLADVSSVKFSRKKAEVPVELLKQPKPVAYRVLRKVFQRLGAWFDIEKIHFDQIVDLANQNGGKKLCLPFDLIAVNDYNKITILENREEEQLYFETPFVVGETETPYGTVCVSKTFTEGCLKFDKNRLPSDAVIRTRKTGDNFCKFGGGTKPLGRYLIDKKVPERKRDKLLLVASQSDVLIICGVEIADTVKTDEQSDVYYITLK